MPVHDEPIPATDALASLAATAFDRFEHAQDGLISEFRKMIEAGDGLSLSEAVELVGEIQREMLRLATTHCFEL
jgi:hypothetical protein